MDCILCDNSDWNNLTENYIICDNCGLIRVKNISSPDLYLFENYCEYQYRNGYLPHHLKFKHDYQIANLRLSYLTNHKSEGSLIDIGAGNGAFVRCANDNGFKAVGYEVDWLVAAIASRISKSHVVDVIENEFYDIVTMFDVIEHLVNPLQIIHSDYLHIELPLYNGDSEWEHFKPEEHIWCFTLETIKLFANKIGYDILDIYTPISLEGKVLNTKAGLIMRNDNFYN